MDQRVRGSSVILFSMTTCGRTSREFSSACWNSAFFFVADGDAPMLAPVFHLGASKVSYRPETMGARVRAQTSSANIYQDAQTRSSSHAGRYVSNHLGGHPIYTRTRAQASKTCSIEFSAGVAHRSQGPRWYLLPSCIGHTTVELVWRGSCRT